MNASPALDHIVWRCLAKDPDERWQSARDLLLELKSVTTERIASKQSSRARPAKDPCPHHPRGAIRSRRACRIFDAVPSAARCRQAGYPP